jgi:hypothetical protein
VPNAERANAIRGAFLIRDDHGASVRCCCCEEEREERVEVGAFNKVRISRMSGKSGKGRGGGEKRLMLNFTGAA